MFDKFILTLVAFIFSASIASAAPANANLAVDLQGPSSVPISTPTTYTVSVKNLGSATAQNIQVVVDFPLTNTSPSTFILGTVSGIDSRCQIANKKLVCNLGSLKNNRSVAVNYTYAAPVSTKNLEMKAVVTSTTGDNAISNNTDYFVPNLSYPNRTISSMVNIRNSHCTGQNLTSYFECLVYSGSLSSHDTVFNTDNTISFPNTTDYTGRWSQASSTNLFFEYFDVNNVKVMEFNGYAVNGSNCFDGLTTFFPASNYVSPYHVCILP